MKNQDVKVEKLRANRRRRRLGAVVTMELLLVLPIVLALLLGLVEFSMLWIARQHVQESARSACRVATFCGNNPAAVTEAAQLALRKQSLVQNAQVLIRGGQFSGDLVAVRVAVPMRAAAPDLLSMFGLGFGQAEIAAEAVMRKE
ncbi:MAG: pilus assembly protein [Planctomycetes bacterium]|nr:pilus assembly protein [Planctomycetota bacterium]